MSVKAILAVLGLLIPAADGQFLNLVAPGNGSTVYFSETQPLRGSGAPAQGRIYSIGAQPLTLVAERPAPVIPEFTYGPFFTGYYSLIRYDSSQNGSVTALTGRRDCTYSDSCGVYRAYSTTLQISGQRVQTIEGGAGYLSANGRYLLIMSVDPLLPGGLIADLETGQQWPLPADWHSFQSTASRVIADDGTFVLADSHRLLIQNGPRITTYFRNYAAEDAVIDASGDTVLYTVLDAAKPSSIHIYRPASNEDVLLYQGDSSAHSAAIAADGRHAAFILDAQAQLF